MLLLDAIQVQVKSDLDLEERSEMSDSGTNFTWDVINFNRDFIWLQIDFENPIYVSKSPRGRDDISLQVLEPNLFISEKSLRSIEKEEIVEANIPP